MEDAFDGPNHGVLMEGINDIGGARIDFEGGSYLISRPLRFPSAGAGTLVISGGTLRASNDFSRYYIFEYITLRDLLIDCNYRGGANAVINSLRTSIDNCYIIRFGHTNGILVQKGHETYIRNSFLGQHITAGGDRGERKYSGTAVNLIGNHNAITDTDRRTLVCGVHCYNKATGFGGTAIYLKLSGLTQSRIVNSKLDYTGIVAENPVQLQVSGTFFWAIMLTKWSLTGTVNGMAMRSTVAKGSVDGNGTSWTVFNPVRNVSCNRVVVETNAPVTAKVYVTVDQ
ncbi:hypothetical protein BRARA_K01791 [Brassica rapa]|uniref:Uncharacterized protein n=1 Tax=Brassica campestris TaxID=3711 RepID=A0A397KY57_BRACM|nr:hypothetical protein BRARA_K01791 [Brassica rapa]